MWTLENTVKTQCKIMQTAWKIYFYLTILLTATQHKIQNALEIDFCLSNTTGTLYGNWAAQSWLPMTIHLVPPPPPSLIRISNDHPWGGYIWIFSGTAQSYPKFILIGTQQSKQNGGLKTWTSGDLYSPPRTRTFIPGKNIFMKCFVVFYPGMTIHPVRASGRDGIIPRKNHVNSNKEINRPRRTHKRHFRWIEHILALIPFQWRP